MAPTQNLSLLVATYDDADSAASDFAALKQAQSEQDFAIIGAVVMQRDDDGEVDVKEHHSGLVGGVATAGGVVGLVVGLFAPPLLLSTAVGAAIGSGVGGLMKLHEEKSMEAEVADLLPPGSSAVLVVVDDLYVDRIERALAKSVKKVTHAVDKGDYDKIAKQLDKAGERITDAIES